MHGLVVKQILMDYNDAVTFIMDIKNFSQPRRYDISNTTLWFIWVWITLVGMIIRRLKLSFDFNDLKSMNFWLITLTFVMAI